MKIVLTLKRITSDLAILQEESGQTISWPASLVPQKYKEGDKIIFTVGEEDDLAKNILNEILNTD
jgi:hypothetical protein